MLQEHVLDLEMGEKMEAMRLLWLTDLGPIFELHYILELYPCKMTWFLELVSQAQVPYEFAFPEERPFKTDNGF